MALSKEYENIVGVKEASGNFSAIAQIASLSGGTVDIYSGNDDQTVPMMALGAKGVISVLSNIAPRAVHDTVDMYLKGNAEKSAELQLKFLNLCNSLFSDVNPIPVKEAMNMLGMDVGACRLPLTEICPSARERLKRSLSELKMI